MKLAEVFTSNMVIQRGAPVRVFGFGKGRVTVELAGNTASLEISNDGKWVLELPEVPVGRGYTMNIDLDGEEVVLRNVAVGDVWLACGQSNMEMPLFRTECGLDEAERSRNDDIRLYTVPKRTYPDALHYEYGFFVEEPKIPAWYSCDEDSVLGFSAIGYYFAKRINKELDIPIGIIACHWGGRKIEAFMKEDFFAEDAEVKEQIEKANEPYSAYSEEYLAAHKAAHARRDEEFAKYAGKQIEIVRKAGIEPVPLIDAPWYRICMGYGFPRGKHNPLANVNLWYTMFETVVPFGVKGLLWYQGEQNAEEKDRLYERKYRLFMKGIRKEFNSPELPFYAVELAPYALTEDGNIEVGGNWASLREQQQRAADDADRSYLVTSIDKGAAYDIHPMDKQPIAYRLANKALKHTYGKDIVADNPIAVRFEANGNEAVIKVEGAEYLTTRNTNFVKIYVADSDGVFKRARITELKTDIRIRCKAVENIEAVRYAYCPCYEGVAIYGSSGLPLFPFNLKK